MHPSARSNSTHLVPLRWTHLSSAYPAQGHGDSPKSKARNPRHETNSKARNTQIQRGCVTADHGPTVGSGAHQPGFRGPDGHEDTSRWPAGFRPPAEAATPSSTEAPNRALRQIRRAISRWCVSALVASLWGWSMLPRSPSSARRLPWG